MADYIPIYVYPKKAPKLIKWYQECKARELDVVRYITTAIRYYALKKQYVCIGTVPESEPSDKRTSMYVKKTSDILTFQKKVEDREMRFKPLIIEILENSIRLADEFSVPNIAELELAFTNLFDDNESVLIEHNTVPSAIDIVPVSGDRNIVHKGSAPTSVTTMEQFKEKSKEEQREEEPQIKNLMRMGQFRGLR